VKYITAKGKSQPVFPDYLGFYCVRTGNGQPKTGANLEAGFGSVFQMRAVGSEIAATAESITPELTVVLSAVPPEETNMESYLSSVIPVLVTPLVTSYFAMEKAFHFVFVWLIDANHAIL
jgi:hypothetical protein